MEGHSTAGGGGRHVVVEVREDILHSCSHSQMACASMLRICCGRGTIAATAGHICCIGRKLLHQRASWGTSGRRPACWKFRNTWHELLYSTRELPIYAHSNVPLPGIPGTHRAMATWKRREDRQSGQLLRNLYRPAHNT